MPQVWRFLSSGALAIALTLPMATVASATRDGTTDGRMVDRCPVRPCTPSCACRFDRWREARLLKFGFGMTANREAAAYWHRRAAEKGGCARSACARQ